MWGIWIYRTSYHHLILCQILSFTVFYESHLKHEDLVKIKFYLDLGPRPYILNIPTGDP